MKTLTNNNLYRQQLDDTFSKPKADNQKQLSIENREEGSKMKNEGWIWMNVKVEEIYVWIVD